MQGEPGEPDTGQATAITDFTASTAPKVRMTRTVTLGERSPGFFGTDIRNDRTVFVTERDADEHRYHGDDPRYGLPFDGQGYALSLDLFARINDTAGTVLIPEPDTGDVYEFAFSHFVDGTPINTDPPERERRRGYEKDVQKVVPIADAVATYPGHADDMMVRQPRYRR